MRVIANWCSPPRVTATKAASPPPCQAKGTVQERCSVSQHVPHFPQHSTSTNRDAHHSSQALPTEYLWCIHILKEFKVQNN